MQLKGFEIKGAFSNFTRTAKICSLPKKKCFKTLLTHSKDFELQLTHWSVGSRNEDFSQEGGGGSEQARESQLAGDSLRCRQ